MRISTRGIYAVEMVTEMALQNAVDRAISVNETAKRRKLSLKYTERLMQELKKSGIVRSERGIYGGYCLAKQPEHITVQEVLSAVEGEMAPVDCLLGDGRCDMECEACLTQSVWRGIWEHILDVTTDVTVGMLAENVRKSIDRKKLQ